LRRPAALLFQNGTLDKQVVPLTRYATNKQEASRRRSFGTRPGMVWTKKPSKDQAEWLSGMIGLPATDGFSGEP